MNIQQPYYPTLQNITVPLETEASRVLDAIILDENQVELAFSEHKEEQALSAEKENISKNVLMISL
jgi:hypothetical protein